MEQPNGGELTKKAMQTKLEQLMDRAENAQNPKVELTDGSWDSKKKTYTHTDSDGITTEYKLHWAGAVEHGNTVTSKSFKTENGVRTEVQFNTAKGSWEPTGGPSVKKTIEWAGNMAKHVGGIEDHLKPDGSTSQALVIEPYKIKGTPRIS